MGTRGFVGLVVNGVEHITYNGMSSGPDWLGRNTLEEIRDLVSTHSPAHLRDLASRLRWPGPIDDDLAIQFNMPQQAGETVRQVMSTNPAFAAHVNEHLAGGFGPRDKTLDDNDESAWRWWLDFQCLTDMLNLGLYEPNPNFPIYSSHCEWGYLIDLDATDQGVDAAPGAFEVYRGFQYALPTAGRWAGLPTETDLDREYQWMVEFCAREGREPWETRASLSNRAKAVELIGRWPLTDLPTLDEFDSWAAIQTAHDDAA